VPSVPACCDSGPCATRSDTGQTSRQGWSLANAATRARVLFPDASHDDGESPWVEAAICRSHRRSA
jgi:hypothetical protein